MKTHPRVWGVPTVSDAVLGKLEGKCYFNIFSLKN